MYMNKKSICIVEEHRHPSAKSYIFERAERGSGGAFFFLFSPSRALRHLDAELSIGDAAAIGGVGVDLSAERLVGAVDEESDVGAVLVKDVTWRAVSKFIRIDAGKLTYP